MEKYLSRLYFTTKAAWFERKKCCSNLHTIAWIL